MGRHIECFTVDQSDKIKWQTIINQLPVNKRDIYFYPDFLKLGESNLEGKSMCFCYSEQNNICVYPFLLRRIEGYEMGDTFYDIESNYGYGGPASNCCDRGFLERFEEIFLEYCKNQNIIAEFIRFHPLIRNHDVFNKNIVVQKNRNTVYLELNEKPEDIWNLQLSGKNRNIIRKAQKSNLYVKELPLEDFNLFEELYKDNMRRVLAEDYYYFGREYFDTLKELICKNGILLGTFWEGKLIASAVFLYTDEYFHYHLGASQKEYLKYAPNNILLYKAIEIAQKNGCRFFHFGGGRTEDKNDTLYKFKKSFSKKEAEFYIGKRVHNGVVYERLIDEWERKNRKKANLFLQYKTY